MNWVPPPDPQGGFQNHHAHHGSSHAPSPPPAACTQLYGTEFKIPTHATSRHCCKESLFFLTHVIVKVAPGSMVRPPSLLFDMVYTQYLAHGNGRQTLFGIGRQLSSWLFIHGGGGLLQRSPQAMGQNDASGDATAKR